MIEGRAGAPDLRLRGRREEHGRCGEAQKRHANRQDRPEEGSQPFQPASKTQRDLP